MFAFTFTCTLIDCSAALMASQLLPLVSRGDVYQQVEWVLLDAHSLLLQQQLTAESHNAQSTAVSCERLSALIRCVSVPVNEHLLQLQLQVSLYRQPIRGMLTAIIIVLREHMCTCVYIIC